MIVSVFAAKDFTTLSRAKRNLFFKLMITLQTFTLQKTLHPLKKLF